MKTNTTPRKRISKKTFKQWLGCEAKALFLLLTTAAGAVTFCLIVDQSWGFGPDKWRWLALAAALMGLPNVWRKLKNSKEPWLIRFAQAYREGFLSLGLIAPEVSGWVTKVRGLWRNLGRKPKSD